MSKMVDIYAEEYYPCYDFYTGTGEKPYIEVADEDYEFVTKAMADFERAQEIMGGYVSRYNAAKYGKK